MHRCPSRRVRSNFLCRLGNPVAILEIPLARSRRGPVARSTRGLQPRRANLRRVEGVARVVPGPIGDVRDQFRDWLHAAAAANRSTSSQIWRTSSSLVRSTPLATLNDSPGSALLQHVDDRAAQVFAEEPIAAFAARRRRSAAVCLRAALRITSGIELLRKLERPEVIRRMDQQHRQTVGAMVRAHKMVGRRLRRGIGRARPIGRRLGRPVRRIDRAEHLVCGNVQETKRLLLGRC